MAIIESNGDTGFGAGKRLHMAAVFHALADPTRLLILEHLRTGEHKVKELTEHLGLAQSTVSAHLACLRESDLVAVRSQGRASLYSINETSHLQKILLQGALLADSATASHQWQEAHPHNGQAH